MALADVINNTILKTGIPDNVATAAATITIKNTGASCAILFRLVANLGAGGAIGAGEATASASFMVSVVRKTGVAAVVGISAAFGGSTAILAGADTITVTAALSAITGAATATETCTLNVTVARGGGTSDNHVCLVWNELLNTNAIGVSVA